MTIAGQTLGYQYWTDAFDGSTLAPQAATLNVVEQQFYGPEQVLAAAGLFAPNDPSENADVEGAWGNRWIPWLELTFSVAASGTVEVYDISRSVVLKTISTFTSETVVYLDQGFLVPQGAVIRITGGGAGRLRYGVVFADTPEAAVQVSIANSDSCCAAYAQQKATEESTTDETVWTTYLQAAQYTVTKEGSLEFSGNLEMDNSDNDVAVRARLQVSVNGGAYTTVSSDSKFGQDEWENCSFRWFAFDQTPGTTFDVRIQYQPTAVGGTQTATVRNGRVLIASVEPLSA